MEFLLYLFLFGLILGSFYNVVGIRLANGESIVTPRSHCPSCHHQLTAWELIPVFSYIYQRGKCKTCGMTISIKYPLFECVTATLFTISPLMVGWSKELLIALLLISLVIIITISDLEKMIIPNKVLLFFSIIMIILRLFIQTEPWWNAYVAAMIGFLLLFIIAIVSKGGMGGGDVKLFFVIGLFVGIKGVFFTLFFASLFGLIYGLIMMVKQRLQRKQPIPFGPFIGIASLLVYFMKEQLSIFLDWLYYVSI
ncbi:leader peptidase (prepilin peptidase)/N-methyltransferase [Cerasibacillus quisquiliarum]|uniref:Type 4 prepilin-like proteins leader peptide-processing enzyme n=1 Tax=Cerasibacillus quisquiliarum TaxID=227865 RepID=A0A511UY02_9BACI|nr:A24 family peptidase [Cerasibacillus quisquiliarum]MBB5145721.1 leader peptidase (prepilin peptidase)/N-methyltransferase [Cerasibacillus quisquiliarum]GEN31514.1 type 4 prepilin-like proteins leader peptide-processing enzyme [Cerasibacillus quisquiliarum]